MSLAGVVHLGLAFAAAVGLAVAQPKPPVPASRNQPIEITSDSAVVDQQRQVATFTGKVLAVQGDMRLNADQLRGYYRQASAAPPPSKPDGKAAGGSISRIEALGRVQITSPTQTAVGEQGIYDVDQRQIVLLNQVVLTQDKNVLRGDRLIVDMDTNHARLDGPNRVSGRFETAQKAAPAPAKPGTGLPSAGNQPIDITADTLDVQHDQQVATFNGSVVATQGDTKLRTDQMRVYYRQAGQPASAEGGSIDRIEASGRVFMSTPRETLEGDQGVYDVNKRTVTVVNRVVLTQDKNVAKGDRLVMHLDTGQYRLDGPNRVFGRFEPAKKDGQQ